MFPAYEPDTAKFVTPVAQWPSSVFPLADGNTRVAHKKEGAQALLIVLSLPRGGTLVKQKCDVLDFQKRSQADLCHLADTASGVAARRK